MTEVFSGVMAKWRIPSDPEFKILNEKLLRLQMPSGREADNPLPKEKRRALLPWPGVFWRGFGLGLLFENGSFDL